MEKGGVGRGDYKKVEKTPSNKKTDSKKQSPELDKRKKSPVPYKKKPKNKVNSEEYHRKRVKDKRKGGNKRSNSAKANKQAKIQWQNYDIQKDRERIEAEKMKKEGSFIGWSNTGKKIYQVEKASWTCDLCGTSNWHDRTECRGCASLLEQGGWACQNCKRWYKGDVEECVDCVIESEEDESDTQENRASVVRHTSHDSCYTIQLDGSSEDSDPPPSVGPQLLQNPQVGFKYHETKKWMFLEWRVAKRGWMFTDLIPILLRLRGRPNSVTLTGYLLTAASEQKVIDYKTAYLVAGLTTEDFDQQISNFFFYEYQSHTEQLRSLALANSKYVDHIRTTSKFMNTLRLMTGSDSWEWFMKILKFIGILYFAYRLLKWYAHRRRVTAMAVKEVVVPFIKRGLKINKINAVEGPPPIQTPMEIFLKVNDWAFTRLQPPYFAIGGSRFPVVVSPYWGGTTPSKLIENPFHQRPSPNERQATALAKFLSEQAIQWMSQLSTWQAVKIVAASWARHLKGWIYNLYLGWRFPTNHNYHAIFPQWPKFSAVFEEILKTIPGMWWVIALIERWQNGDWRTYKWHKRSRSWTFLTRVREHLKLNSAEPGELYQSYDKFVKTGEFCCPTGIEPGVKTVDRMSLPIPKVDEKKEYATIKHPENAVPCKNVGKVYIGLWFVSRFVGISNSFENNECALRHRILDIPNSVVKKHSVAWKKYVEIYKQIKLDREDLPEWHLTLNARQKKNLKDAEENDLKQVSFRHLKCQIKSDEMLNAKEKMVPRFLTNQAGQEFLRMGKATAEINHWLANVYWNPTMDHPMEFDGHHITACFAHGTTSAKLNLYTNAAYKTKGIHGMFLGDDTGAIVNIRESQTIENDFSGFDRSECDDLRKEDDDCLERNGFHLLVQDKKIMYAKKLYIPSNKYWGRKLSPIKDRSGNKVEMRMTGESDTCGGNTRINFASTMSGIVSTMKNGVVNLDKLKKHYANLGLTAKLKCVAPNRLTFLKGVFLRNDDLELCWVRLPSFLFKFGKVLTDPNVNDKRPLSYNAKIRACVLGQWKGYGDMRTNWFYTAIHNEIYRICGGIEEFVCPLEDWQVFQSPTWIPDHEWDSFMMDRYHMHREDMEEIIYSFKLIDPEDLPCLHRVQCLDKLDVDY